MTVAEPVDWYARATQAADLLRERFQVPEVSATVVLGSGWGPAAAAFGPSLAELPISRVPHAVAPAAPGHTDLVTLHDLAGERLLVWHGRTHRYEGHGAGPVVHAVRTSAALGARVALLTNANGSFRPEWRLGEVALVTDHLNLTADSPLEGARFLDLTDLYSARLRALARRLAPELHEGIYAMFPGPHYETNAEARAAAALGADLVGMSTVFEAIAARELGVEVVAFSTVTANEFAPEQIDPDDVVAIAEASAGRLGPVLRELLSHACRADGPQEPTRR